MAFKIHTVMAGEVAAAMIAPGLRQMRSVLVSEEGPRSFPAPAARARTARGRRARVLEMRRLGVRRHDAPRAGWT